MGIRVEVDSADQDIYHINFDVNWTWEDFDASVDEMTEYAQNLPYPVALIVDVSRVGRLPKGNILMHLRRTDMMLSNNVKLSVLVNAPHAVTTFMSILMRVRPRAKSITRYARSFEEARTLVSEWRMQQERLTE